MSDYEVELFRSEGFNRRKCSKCGKAYWTLSDSETCGEPPCDEYTFIDNSPTKKRFSLHEMREFFLSFFEKNGHKRIARYPIVSRWREDTFFTIASVSCFQPWVLNLTIEPPANPLTMSQPCLRFNDIDNVGKTGRHLTEFEMMAHHAFNTRDNQVYFKDRTVELCHELLLELGIQPETISYLESDWAGGGNSGPCFETIVGGVELATLVFMMYEDTPNGKKDMPMQVVDTGYGLERFTWISQGSPSAYEAIFGKVLEKLKKEASITPNPEILAEYSKVAGMMSVESKSDLDTLRKMAAERLKIPVDKLTENISPMENLYSVCDHTRSLMFMLNDGVVPSNVKAGYFGRLLIRRSLRSLRNLNLSIPLADIMGWQVDYFAKDFPEMKENKSEILELVEVEEDRYEGTVGRGQKIVADLGKKITTKELITLYDTYGLVPELVKEFSDQDIKIPDDFYIQVAARHEKPEEEKEAKIEIKLPDNIPPTQLGYYEDQYVKEFESKILSVFDNYVILDKTYFYPAGGGQETDLGVINGLMIDDVTKVGQVVLHKIKDSGLEEGQTVSCKLNWDRRLQLMQHHTTAHIINGAARKVLGNHIWQAGAHKNEELGRLDITHYAGLSDEEMREIEDLSNKVVKDNLPVDIQFMPRNKAEELHGFRIYQGGAVPGKDIRIVDIKNWDVEACGGTHFSSTGEVGEIKLIRAKRIQDGVLRLEFKAGGATQKHLIKRKELVKQIRLGDSASVKTNEADLKQIASIFSVQIEQLPKTLERFKKEWQEQRAELETMDAAENYNGIPPGNSPESARQLFDDWKSQRKELERLRCSLKDQVLDRIKGQSGVIKELTSCLDAGNLTEIANSALGKDTLLILANKTGDKANVVVASSSSHNAAEIASALCKKLGGGAHGNEKLAVGGGSSKNLEKVIREFKTE